MIRLETKRLDDALEAKRLWPSLSCDEQERAKRFVFERDRIRYVVGRGWLRGLLAVEVGREPPTLEFEYGPRGKPRLKDFPRCHFNLAHSDDLAVCGIGPVELGVDVEFVRPIPDAVSLARNFFTRREFEKLFAMPSNEQPRAFFELWTRKEAYLKASGEGISESLNQVEVAFGPGVEPRILEIAGDPGQAIPWKLLSFEPSASFLAAAAWVS